MGFSARRFHSPPFKGGEAAQRPGWLVKGRVAILSLFEITNHIEASPYRARASRPSAPLRNGIFLLMAQPPLLGKEGNGPVSLPTHSHRVATCRTVLITNQFSIFHPRGQPA